MEEPLTAANLRLTVEHFGTAGLYEGGARVVSVE
jgi:hypothetical protein